MALTLVFAHTGQHVWRLRNVLLLWKGRQHQLPKWDKQVLCGLRQQHHADGRFFTRYRCVRRGRRAVATGALQCNVNSVRCANQNHTQVYGPSAPMEWNVVVAQPAVGDVSVFYFQVGLARVIDIAARVQCLRSRCCQPTYSRHPPDIHVHTYIHTCNRARSIRRRRRRRRLAMWRWSTVCVCGRTLSNKKCNTNTYRGRRIEEAVDTVG